MFNLLYQNFYSMKKCKADDIYKMLKFLLAIILSFTLLLIAFFCAVFCILSFTFQNMLLNIHYCVCVCLCVHVEAWLCVSLILKENPTKLWLNYPFLSLIAQLIGKKFSLRVCVMNLRKLNYLTFIRISLIINVFKNWQKIREWYRLISLLGYIFP